MANCSAIDASLYNMSAPNEHMDELHQLRADNAKLIALIEELNIALKTSNSIHISNHAELLQIMEKYGARDDENLAALLHRLTAATIEQCAVTVETEVTGTRYQWINGSLFAGLTKEIATQIRKLAQNP